MDKSNSSIILEDWMNKKWRPLMGYCYMITCIFDFIIAPILWSIAQALGQGQVSMQWQPLTLQGAGFFHISMGTILGLATWGRTREKISGANVHVGPVGTTYIPPHSPVPTDQVVANQKCRSVADSEAGHDPCRN
jgi:hypothetical protein